MALLKMSVVHTRSTCENSLLDCDTALGKVVRRCYTAMLYFQTDSE